MDRLENYDGRQQSYKGFNKENQKSKNITLKKASKLQSGLPVKLNMGLMCKRNKKLRENVIKL